MIIVEGNKRKTDGRVLRVSLESALLTIGCSYKGRMCEEARYAGK